MSVRVVEEVQVVLSMRTLLVALALLAGCYAPTPPDIEVELLPGGGVKICGPVIMKVEAGTLKVEAGTLKVGTQAIRVTVTTIEPVKPERVERW